MSGLFGLAIFGLVIFVIVKVTRRRKKPDTGTLVVSGDISAGASLSGGKSAYTSPPVDDAVRIYLHETQLRRWCCPNCQCENDDSRSSCCVCNYKK